VLQIIEIDLRLASHHRSDDTEEAKPQLSFVGSIAPLLASTMAPPSSKRQKTLQKAIKALQKELKSLDTAKQSRWIPAAAWRDEKEYILVAVELLDRVSIDFMQVLSKKLQDDKDVVLVVLAKGRGTQLHYVSKRLQADMDVAMAAIGRNRMNWRHVSRSLLRNRDLWLYGVSKESVEWKLAPVNVRND